MSAPADRLKRILSEGGTFTVRLPGQTSIDVTPDVMALLGGDSNIQKTLDDRRNLLNINDLGRDVATRVQFV